MGWIFEVMQRIQKWITESAFHSSELKVTDAV